MARSLSRSTQLYVSTETSGINSPDAQNLFEIKVLDGYSFSQDVANIEIGVSEAGSTPTRGTLAFNTALNPVDVSFSTYVRAYQNTVEVDGTANPFADCVERVLWGSAMGDAASWTEVSTNGASAGEVVEAQDGDLITFGLDQSVNNELQKLTLYFVLENTTYVVDDFSAGTAEVDFSIDGIATINWSGQGSLVTENKTYNTAYFRDTLTAGTDYTAVPTTTAATFLRNKLSVLTLKNNVVDASPAVNDEIMDASIAGNVITYVAITDLTAVANLVGGRIHNTILNKWRTILSVTADSVTVDDSESGQTAQEELWTTAHNSDLYDSTQEAGVIYNIPITGATLTLENNFTYLTPEELAIVNKPLAGFAGNRIVSGSLTAYLNTGAEGSGGLLQDMLSKIENAVTNNYELKFFMGGNSGKYVLFDLPTCQIGVPSTSVEDIISTEISFTAKPTTGAQAVAEGSFEATNEMTITYYDGVA